MPRFLKFLLPFALLAGCSGPAEDQLPRADEKSNSSAEETSADPSQALSTDTARRMLPEAASLSRAEFSQILQSPPVTLKEIKNQSLTALLLAIDPLQAQEQNPNVIGDFHYLSKNGGDPDPQRILTAIQGEGETNFVSVIQPEYITKCTCQNRGGTTQGHIEYRAGNIYAGSAEFTAERQGDHWEIVAFRLPEYRLSTHRQADGTWRLESADELLGIAYP